MYAGTGAEEVVFTSCAEEGIFLIYHALLRPGDHAIVETPCYESALQLARSTGAEVSQWRRRYEDGWAHELDALAGLVRPETRLIYLNQPHNPTGTLMARPVFEQVLGLARAHGLVVFSDEVYRELEHDPAIRLPAACDEYERAVSLGSISKSYGLPGLRIAEAGVLLLPGSVYDQPEHVRIGFGRANMPEALSLLEANIGGG